MTFTVTVHAYGHFEKEEYRIARFLRQAVFNSFGDMATLTDESGRKVVLQVRGVEPGANEFPVTGL